MTELQIGLWLIAMLALLVAAGVPVPAALAMSAFAGTLALKGDLQSAWDALATPFFKILAADAVLAIPLFILMGRVLCRADTAAATISLAARPFARGAGRGDGAMVVGYALMTLMGFFMSAPAPVFARPVIKALSAMNMPRRQAAGAAASASTLAMLLPPSLPLFYYAALTGLPVSVFARACLLAGAIVVVGWLLFAMSWRFARPNGEPRSTGTAPARLPVERGTAAMIAVALFIVAALCTGVLTPLQTGLAGAIAALAATQVMFGLERTSFVQMLRSTLLQSFIAVSGVAAAFLFASTMEGFGVPAAFAERLHAFGLGRWGFLAFWFVLIIILETLLDAPRVLLLAVPVAVPIAFRFGFDPLHFGIMTLLALAGASLLPPFGMTVFQVKVALHPAAPEIDEIFAGAAPYASVLLAVLALIALVPWIVAARF